MTKSASTLPGAGADQTGPVLTILTLGFEGGRYDLRGRVDQAGSWQYCISRDFSTLASLADDVTGEGLPHARRRAATGVEVGNQHAARDGHHPYAGARHEQRRNGHWISSWEAVLAHLDERCPQWTWGYPVHVHAAFAARILDAVLSRLESGPARSQHGERANARRLADWKAVCKQVIEDDCISRAAEAIARADALLVTAGAGMGVDSGLPDFRGDEGFWRAYPAYRGLSFVTLANPRWFRDDPSLAWGFYGHRLNLYRATRPHAGFELLRTWGAARSEGLFAFTSNVDGQFQRAGFDPDRIVECHGTIDTWQCTTNCPGGLIPAGLDEIALDPVSFRATGTLPSCPTCGALARPNVLMFGDGAWDGSRTAAQRQRMEAWLTGLRAKGARLAIVECGAGTALPTVRRLGEDLAQQLGATLIRINAHEAQAPDAAISIALGAREALERIDAAMTERANRKLGAPSPERGERLCSTPYSQVLKQKLRALADARSNLTGYCGPGRWPQRVSDAISPGSRIVTLPLDGDSIQCEANLSESTLDLEAHAHFLWNLPGEMRSERELPALLNSVLTKTLLLIAGGQALAAVRAGEASGTIFLANERGELTAGATVGNESRIASSAILPHAMRERAAVLVHDATVDFRSFKGFVSFGSAIVVPLLHRDTILGALSLELWGTLVVAGRMSIFTLHGRHNPPFPYEPLLVLDPLTREDMQDELLEHIEQMGRCGPEEPRYLGLEDLRLAANVGEQLGMAIARARSVGNT